MSLPVDRGFAFKNKEALAEQIDHIDVVVNDHNCLLVVFGKTVDNSCDHGTLFNIKVGTWLVQDIEVCFLGQAGSNRYPLQFSTTEVGKQAVIDPFKLERV